MELIGFGIDKIELTPCLVGTATGKNTIAGMSLNPRNRQQVKI